MKKKALFIINPVAGGKKKDEVPAVIEQHLDHSKFDHAIIYTTGVSHAREIAAAAATDYDVVVAVGGDGTINEVASSLVNTRIVLGVVPFGSGNGLSRFLSIPMAVAGALETINNYRVERIDAGTVNDQYFFNMAGMGFDAHISEVFSHDKKRGFGAYIKSSFREVMNYRSEHYRVSVDGSKSDHIAFMLSLANSSQYGNNAHISPFASVQDGLIDVCVVKPFPLYKFILMGIIMFTKTAHLSKYVKIIKGNRVMIDREKPGPVHLDGEPQMMLAKLEIKVLPNALNIIVGADFKSTTSDAKEK